MPGETGIRCQVGDPRSLADGISHLLDDPGEAERLAYRDTVARNLMLGHALDEALDALGGAGVRVQPLKGALVNIN